MGIGDGYSAIANNTQADMFQIFSNAYGSQYFVHFADLLLEGNNAMGKAAIHFANGMTNLDRSRVGSAHSLIERCKFIDWGDSNGNGQAIVVEPDTPALEIRNNMFSIKGLAILISGPTDTLNIHDNYITQD